MKFTLTALILFLFVANIVAQTDSALVYLWDTDKLPKVIQIIKNTTQKKISSYRVWLADKKRIANQTPFKDPFLKHLDGYISYISTDICHQPDFLLFRTLIYNGITLEQLSAIPVKFSMPLCIDFSSQKKIKVAGNFASEHKQGINIITINDFLSLEYKDINIILVHEFTHYIQMRLNQFDHHEALSEIVHYFIDVDCRWRRKRSDNTEHANDFFWFYDNYGFNLNRAMQKMLVKE